MVGDDQRVPTKPARPRCGTAVRGGCGGKGSVGLSWRLGGVLGMMLACICAPWVSTARAGNTWLPVRDHDLKIVPGSALDFSHLLGPGDPMDTPVGVDTAGHLALDGGKGARRRFLCASMEFSAPNGLFPGHRQADMLARQLAMHGYNMARLTFVDAALMQGRHRDFDYDPEQVDRFHYLLAALKRNGIRWMIDAMTSWNGAYGDVGKNRFSKTHALPRDLYFHPGAQAHWRHMVDTILAVKNPYTGKEILKDPALAVVTLVNEGGMRFVYHWKRARASLRGTYQRWLQKNGLPERDMPGLWSTSPSAVNLNRFMTETEISTAKWMTAYLRSLGYRGLTTDFGNGRTLQAAVARAQTDVTTIHGYFGLPTRFSTPGSQEKGGSLVAAALPMVREFSIARNLGKPFVVQEYDQPYWSPWRREVGLSVPAYAAFQDWDGICRYSNPVVLQYTSDGPPRQRAIYPFGIGMDPVARAGETLAALLFRRGDVRKDPKVVRLSVSRQTAMEAGASTGLSMRYGPLALVARTGIAGLAGTGGPESALDMVIHKSDLIGLAAKAHRIAARINGPTAWFAPELVKHGVLPKDNATVADGDVFQSDTGQILVSPPERTMTVVTPRTEAAVFDEHLPLRLGSLTILSASAPALVAVSAIDGRPLKTSNRMLLILATDAVNSDAKFDDGRRVLRRLGHLPVLLRTDRVRLRIDMANSSGFKLYALALNGKRRESVPVTHEGGRLDLTLDTAALKKGPTTYFELVRNSVVSASP